MTLAEQEELPYAMTMTPQPIQNLPVVLMSAPDFIEQGHGPTAVSATSVMRQCDGLRRQLKVEDALLKRLPDSDKPAQQRRVEALYAMVQQGLEYAQMLRGLDRPEAPYTFGGFAIDDRVLICGTGGIHGTVKAFSPAFEPTHIMVQSDAGWANPYRPDQLMPARED